MNSPKAFWALVGLGILLAGTGILLGQANNLMGSAQAGGTITGTVILRDEPAATPGAGASVIALPGNTCKLRIVGCGAPFL